MESDLLGITKTTTIGYLTNLHLKLMNCTFLKPLLLSMLKDVVLNPDLACELDPSMKTQQTKAMSNGVVLVIKPPQFEICQTRIICGRNKEKFPLTSSESSTF